MNKEFNAKRYFIDKFKRCVNNDNKILSQKRFAGIRELLFDYIQLHNDIIENIENDKFKKSRIDMLKSMDFFLEESILSNHSVYKHEISVLKSKIKECISDDKNNNTTKDNIKYVRIYNISTSLLRKLGRDNLYEYAIETAKQKSNFNEIDKIVDFLISEMIYEGYSLNYLSEWNKQEISKNINEENIDGELDKFKLFKKNKIKYKYYVPIKSIFYDIGQQRYINSNVRLDRVENEELDIIDRNNETNITKFILQDKEAKIYSIEIECMDVYKGLELIVNSFNSYFQVINTLVHDDKSKDRNYVKLTNKCIVVDDKNKYFKLRIENYDEDTLFSILERKEKQEVEDFIKYRDKAYENMESIDEIDNIQRAINIVRSQKNQSKENRLINLWSVMEYILTFNEGSSIISNIKDIIPKVVCLYAIKDKINTFWSQLYKYEKSNISIVNEFITFAIKEDEEYQYDLEKLIEFINNKGETLSGEFNFNSSLQRSISEIGQLLDDKESRSKLVKKLSKEVEHDIIRIYRSRNILIHSGKREIINLDYKALRLYKYNNHLIALIIYYKSKDPSLTITEILNSIGHTYDEYIKNLGKKNISKIELCKPRYLFI